MTVNFRLILRIIAELAVPLPLLLGAGTVRWPAGWLLMAIFYGVTFATWWMLAARNPDLLHERMSSLNQSEQPVWDKILMALIMLLQLLWLAVMGVDAVRFQWSHVPFPLRVLGLLGLGAAMFFMIWTYRVNTHLAAVVKVKQTGQDVISTGPYAVVRHPLYASAIMAFPCVALLLGSWWGLITAPVVILPFVLRTYLEDHKLRQELQGYAEYSRKVRYRLAPGIW